MWVNSFRYGNPFTSIDIVGIANTSRISMNLNPNTCFHSKFEAFVAPSTHNLVENDVSEFQSRFFPSWHHTNELLISSPFDISPTRCVYITEIILELSSLSRMFVRFPFHSASVSSAGYVTRCYVKKNYQLSLTHDHGPTMKFDLTWNHCIMISSLFFVNESGIFAVSSWRVC